MTTFRFALLGILLASGLLACAEIVRHDGDTGLDTHVTDALDVDAPHEVRKESHAEGRT